MTSKIGNLVQQTTASLGAGALTVASIMGKRSFFTHFGSGGSNVFFYFISHRTANQWEVGTGHMSDATTLVRDTVIMSSNANTFVVFSAGTKDVVNELPAHVQQQLEKVKVYNEIPAGALNGINLIFTTDLDFLPGSNQVYLNGLRLALGAGMDYTETGANQITMEYAPSSSDVIIIDYQQL